jgi:hypothetical protein
VKPSAVAGFAATPFRPPEALPPERSKPYRLTIQDCQHAHADWQAFRLWQRVAFEEVLVDPECFHSDLLVLLVLLVLALSTHCIVNRGTFAAGGRFKYVAIYAAHEE